MIGLDTNVLVRYFTQDDAAQSARASRLIEDRCTDDDPGYLGLVTLCEVVWVLASGYGYERADIARLVRGILTTSALQVEHEDRVWHALRLYEGGKSGFADCVIAATCREADAAPVYSLDQQAVRDGLATAVP